MIYCPSRIRTNFEGHKPFIDIPVAISTRSPIERVQRSYLLVVRFIVILLVR